MHSPDFKVSNEDMKKHHGTLLQLAETLQPHVPEMKDLEKEITQVDGKLFSLLLGCCSSIEPYYVYIVQIPV